MQFLLLTITTTTNLKELKLEIRQAENYQEIDTLKEFSAMFLKEVLTQRYDNSSSGNRAKARVLSRVREAHMIGDNVIGFAKLCFVYTDNDNNNNNKKAVGFYMYNVPPVHDAPAIGDIYVIPEFRRKGIATKMIQDFVKTFVDYYHYYYPYLYIFEPNVAVLRILEKMQDKDPVTASRIRVSG